GAAPGAGQDVVDALDRGVLAEDRAEDRQLDVAEAAAGTRGDADRAVVLDQQPAALDLLDRGHVAFGLADRGQRPDTLAERCVSREPLPVVGGDLLAPRLQQPGQAL